MEIPTLTEYDGKSAKVRCSVHWVITHAYQNEDIPKYIPRCDIEHIFECDGGVKKTIASLLCSGEPYCRITEQLFDVKELLRSHEDVIQILCSRGIYVLDDSDSLIRADHLRRMPLALFSHIKIIDILMKAHTLTKLASVNSLVTTVRKFSEFSASKESPDNLEEAFMLWLNKVSQKVHIIQRNALESDKWFHRLLRHTFGQPREDDSQFPLVSKLTDDLYDGRAIALLLHYYCSSFISFQDISMKDPISMADAWHNLQLSINFCNDILLPHTKSNLNAISPTILHAVDFLYCSPHMNMNVNIMAFLGNLYHYLETNALQDIVSPLGHSVICRRQRETGSEDNTSSVSETTEPQTLSYTSMDERHQETLAQASYLIPGVQPLISNATKRSFSKPSTADTDSVSTLTLNESDESSLPFSSKPLLVRRNRDIHHHGLPSSTSKLYTRALTDHLPAVKSREHNDDYMSDENTSASSVLHPLRKSSSHQGLSNGVIDHPRDVVVNKWHSRTPVQDLRNTNTSNNTYVTNQQGLNILHNDASSRTMTTDSLASVNSDLLANVAMDIDDENLKFKRRDRKLAQVHTFSARSRLPTGSLSTTVFDSPHIRHKNENDMILETARTPDSQSTRSTLLRNVTDSSSSSNSDFTSVSSRTTSNVTSQDCNSSVNTFTNSDERDYPVIVNTDESPELPRNVTRVKPYRNPSTGTSSNFTPSSQKSYTIQNGDFESVDSARAAGYPVIETSPERTKLEFEDRSSQLRSSGSTSKPSYATNGSGDHVVIGDSVVRLRNPQRRSNNRSLRNMKATSWVDNGKALKVHNSDDSRRHSNIPNSGKLSVVFKKIEERRKYIETERRRIEERKKVVEEEKKMRQKEWSKELSKLHKEMEKLDFHDEQNEQQQKQVQQQKPATVPHHVIRSPTKNEETSSDYSSKSPSPSSINNNNISEQIECENKILRQFVEQNPPESPHSETYNNFFASPLSTTTCLAQRNEQSKSNIAMDQTYQNIAPSHSAVNSRLSDQKQTFDVSPDRSRIQHSTLPPHSNKTYNVSQPGMPISEQPNHRNILQPGPKPVFDSFEKTMMTSLNHDKQRIRSNQMIHDHSASQQGLGMYQSTNNGTLYHPNQIHLQESNNPFVQKIGNLHFQPVNPNVHHGTSHISSHNQDNRQMTYEVFDDSSTAQFSSQDIRQRTYKVSDGQVDKILPENILNENHQFRNEFVPTRQDMRHNTYNVSNSNYAQPLQNSHQTSAQNLDQRHMTYDVSDTLNNAQPTKATQRVPMQPREAVHPGVLKIQAPEINIHQSSPEHTTRRSLFPGGNQDPDTFAEQENIDPNYLATGPADETTYDTFSCKIASGSNHSTPQKMSPLQGSPSGQETCAEDETDMSSVLMKTTDVDKKGGKGFEIVDDATPNTDVAKKKEQFLLKQLKKEEELKRKKADRENQAEKRKEEARKKQEELLAKKEEEKLKRQHRLDEYKKRKLQDEEAQFVQQSSAIKAGGSGKKHPPSSAKSESASHTARSHRVTKSGRTSPESTVLTNNYEHYPVHNAVIENHETYLANMDAEDGSACSFPMQKMHLGSGHKKEWDNQSASSSAVSSEYTGPKLYKQPSSKSNKHIVNNAISHCCLPGKVNETSRNNTIQVLEMSDARHFMILFRDAKCQFRALYSYDPDGEHLKRLAGNGPVNIVPSMIERLFKYNSGRKAFTSLPSKTLSVSIDAITIKNSLWQSNKKVSSKK
uniref:calmodulin-regulated spectrin-associated protein 1-B-like isoform X1 n=1 Tax=Styela clava TaxID=7725 RepID=UPI0019398CAE|nr:calmodulin-regulated spectrin-associated protein 1-B-like isoform X1 [Styela clava]